MNFLLCSMILMCSVQIVSLDRYTSLELFIMHYHRPNFGHALVYYSNETILCEQAWNSQYYPEIPYVYLYCNPTYKIEQIKPILKNCPGFDCWESQLTVVTRVELVEIMNRYREKVAEGRCIKWCANNTRRLAFELRWNYYLEQNATVLLEKCPQNHMINRSYVNVAEFGRPLVPGYREIVVTSFKMETGLQSELKSILWRLMYENYLNDWDEEWQFRRGDMHDVACAFICRRNVNYVTDMNETVVNGIVGHLSCVFVSSLVVTMKEVIQYEDGFYTIEVPSPIDTTLIPSAKNCTQVDPSSWSYGVENYYPVLCKRDPGAYLPGILIYDGCDYRPKDKPYLCPGSEYSRITWGEKFYGMILRFNQTFPNRTTKVDVGECNVPPPKFPTPEKFGPNILNYFCTLKEVVSVQANISTCSGWNCADSQLTDATRFQILEGLNHERNRIANGECSEECPHPCKRCNINAQYCNMVNVQWHWFLERKASERVKNCPTSTSVRVGFTYDDDPFPVRHRVVYEEITLLFDLPYYEGQLALPKTFVKLFWMNAFKDWTDYHYFRRANAQFIGCSIITRPYTIETVEILPEMNFYNGIPTHMVCIYASLNGSFFSMLNEPHVPCCPQCNSDSYVNPCWMEFFKNVTPVQNLCYSDQLIVSMNCQASNRCDDDSLSKAWYIQYEGLTLAQSLNGTFIPIKHAAFNSIGIRYERKYCSPVVFIFFLQIPLWVFILYTIYSLQDIKVKELLKKSVIPSIKFRLPEFASKQETSQKKSSQKSSKKMSKRKQSKKHYDVESAREIPPDSAVSPESARTKKKAAKKTRPEVEYLSEDTPDSELSQKRALAKKSTKKTHPQAESEKETPRSKGTPDSEPAPKGTRAKKPTKQTFPPEIRTTKITTREPYTAPVPKKTPIREARPEDDNLDDEEWEMEAYGGPTATIGIKLVAPAKIFTGRPRKERKAPKRAKTTPK